MQPFIMWCWVCVRIDVLGQQGNGVIPNLFFSEDYWDADGSYNATEFELHFLQWEGPGLAQLYTYR